MDSSTDSKPEVTEAAGSVGRQIQREWAVLREYIFPYKVTRSAEAERQNEAIRKLDALIGYDDAK